MKSGNGAHDRQRESDRNCGSDLSGRPGPRCQPLHPSHQYGDAQRLGVQRGTKQRLPIEVGKKLSVYSTFDTSQFNWFCGNPALEGCGKLLRKQFQV